MWELSNNNYVINGVKPTIVTSLGAIPKSNSKVRLIHDASRPYTCLLVIMFSQIVHVHIWTCGF